MRRSIEPCPAVRPCSSFLGLYGFCAGVMQLSLWSPILRQASSRWCSPSRGRDQTCQCSCTVCGCLVALAAPLAVGGHATANMGCSCLLGDTNFRISQICRHQRGQLLRGVVQPDRPVGAGQLCRRLLARQLLPHMGARTDVLAAAQQVSCQLVHCITGCARKVQGRPSC